MRGVKDETVKDTAKVFLSPPHGFRGACHTPPHISSIPLAARPHTLRPAAASDPALFARRAAASVRDALVHVHLLEQLLETVHRRAAAAKGVLGHVVVDARACAHGDAEQLGEEVFLGRGEARPHLGRARRGDGGGDLAQL
eukprot:5028848-Prymnesium_polylepis.1